MNPQPRACQAVPHGRLLRLSESLGGLLSGRVHVLCLLDEGWALDEAAPRQACAVYSSVRLEVIAWGNGQVLSRV